MFKSFFTIKNTSAVISLIIIYGLMHVKLDYNDDISMFIKLTVCLLLSMWVLYVLIGHWIVMNSVISKVKLKKAQVIINGVTLTEAQSMALRVAIESFDADLKAHGLGDDKNGVVMSTSYMERISEIRSALYQ